MQPELQPVEKQVFENGLWDLHRQTSKLPPLTDRALDLRFLSIILFLSFAYYSNRPDRANQRPGCVRSVQQRLSRCCGVFAQLRLSLCSFYLVLKDIG